MKQKWVDAYMDVAERFAQLSSAIRLKVGAVVVKEHRIVSIGYNGTPMGWDNNCEYKDYISPWRPEFLEEDGTTYTLRTKAEVIHAEANAIAKLARDGESGRGATLFCTHAPCIECAKLIHGAGINKVYYRDVYRNDHGITFLNTCGVDIARHSR